MPVLLWRFFTETFVDRAQAARHLVLEVDGVVDDVQIGVRAPGPDGFVVHLPRAFNGFVAHGVAEVVGELRALGAGDKMQHGVVAREDFLLRFAEGGEDGAELVVGDVGFVVEDGAVVEDEDVLLRHHRRRAQRELLFVELVGDDEILELQHRDTAAERADAEAGHQLGRRFGDGDDAPAIVLFEFLQDAAGERRFACGGAASQYDARDAFCHNISPSL